MMFDADPNKPLHPAPQDPAPQDLAADDAAALEALLAAGFDPAAVPEARRERSRRMLKLLNALESSPMSSSDRGVLVDVTMARVMRTSREAGPGSAQPLMLTEADVRAVDAMADAGFDARGVLGDLQPRARKLGEVGSLLRASVTSTSVSASLVDAVMAKVQGVESSRGERMKLRPDRGPMVVPSLGRWRDVLSAAAVLMVATSVVWTLAGATTHYARRASCMAGLGGVATAMGQYTNDFNGELPMAAASMAGQPWWDVQRDKAVSNSSNLFTLARKNYAPLSSLACPGNADACRSASCEPDAVDWSSLKEVSYSYQIMFGQHRPVWKGATQRVVLADRSPVVRRAVMHQAIRPDENSVSHDGAGQQVLFSDGSVRWLRTPVLPSGDNIWLPMPTVMLNQQPTGIEIHGNELPTSPDDGFVGP